MIIVCTSEGCEEKKKEYDKNKIRGYEQYNIILLSFKIL